MSDRRKMSRLWIALALLALAAAPAFAYIGPGAGFAFLSSFMVLFVTFLLAVVSILIWPIRVVIRLLTRAGKLAKTDVDRVIVVGYDGLEPKLARKWMDEGKLPSFKRLADKGDFQPLFSSWPSMSPVAWSTFATSTDASKHNQFDFLNRDPKTYVPDLASVKITNPTRSIKIGKYRIPLGKPVVKLMQRSTPFWKILGDHHIFSQILRVPITFPPVKFNGALLSAMCVPDLAGTQGTFTFFTTDEAAVKGATGGVRKPLVRRGNAVKAYIPGPANSMTEKQEELRIPLEVTIDDTKELATFKLPGETFKLGLKEYSPWKKVAFKPGLGIKVNGIVRFYIMSFQPHFELYLSPTQIDPEKPAMPISEPVFYSVYLAKLFGPYSTLGLAEDTWALNERVIDEDAFLKQVWINHDEREKQFFNALKQTKRGLVACVFDCTDRIQHMFWRYFDPNHPANVGKDGEIYKDEIEKLYVRMDELLGRIMKECDDTRTVLMLMSDHGFTEFSRGMNLNSWLVENGYMTMQNGDKTCQDWFRGVDWTKTKAYSFGLTGIYLNKAGREGQGIVAEEDAVALKREIAGKLKGCRDEERGRVAVRDCLIAEDLFHGPYVENGPDIYPCFDHGYRTSWEAAVGKADGKVFHDNGKSWSGDHCVDPRIVPGVFFCNRRLARKKIGIVDIGASVLDLFGIPIPRHMTGRSFFRADPSEEAASPEGAAAKETSRG
ncbi:MAG: alkaline phosphatase family protein [Candidatus Eisenbacteria bacterium]